MMKSPGDYLLLRYLEGSCSPEERKQIEKWLLADPSHADKFEMFALKYASPVSIDKNSVREEIFRSINETSDLSGNQVVFPEKHISQPQLLRMRTRLHQWLPAAAVIIIALTGGIFTYFWHSDVPEAVEVALIEHAVPPGTSKTITLRDGTTVRLNAGSTLQFSENFGMGTEKREVFLEGEAFFEVTNTGDNPFVVHSAKLETTVLGTAFNVKAYPADDLMQVSVAEGMVYVKQKSEEFESESVLLEPDQWATYEQTSGTFNKEQGDIRGFIAWKDGVLLFHDKTVAEVSTMLERWYDTTIHIENEEVKDCLIYGEYQDRSLETVLKMMQFTLDIDYAFVDEGVSITGGDCQ